MNRLGPKQGAPGGPAGGDAARGTAAGPRPAPRAAAPAGGTRQFSGLRASELFCPTCKRAMPVRERLLLLLLDGELHEFLCARCGTSLGTRQVQQPPTPLLTRF